MRWKDAFRRALPFLRVAYVAGLIAVLAWQLAAHWDDLGRLVRGASPLPLIAALATALAQIGLSSAFWTSALSAMGERARWSPVVLATVRSLPARHLPGSVWYVVGKMVLLRQSGFAKRSLAVAGALETLLTPMVGLTLGALLLALSRRGAQTPWITLLAAAALLTVTSPPAINLGLRLLARWRGGGAVRLPWGRHLRLVAWNVGFWSCSALTFFLYLSAFPEITVPAGPVQVTGAYMFAWGVGFLAVFAPQGLGVFELTFVSLAGLGELPGVVLVVAGFRVLMIARDLLLLPLMLRLPPARVAASEPVLGESGATASSAHESAAHE